MLEGMRRAPSGRLTNFVARGYHREPRPLNTTGAPAFEHYHRQAIRQRGDHDDQIDTIRSLGNDASLDWWISCASSTSQQCRKPHG
jgi:hypothetical protein